MRKYGIEIKWGIIFTIISLIWMFLERSFGWHDELIEKHAIYTNSFAFVAIVVYVVALLDKRSNAYNGKMTYREGFIAGIAISIVVAILSPLSQWITHTYISPEYFEHAINNAVENKGITRAKAESTFNLNAYIYMSLFFAVFAGVITSAVVAIFVRKK